MHVPVELNPKLNLSEPLSVTRVMKLGAPPAANYFPSPWMVPLTVRWQHARLAVEGATSPGPSGGWELAIGVRPYTKP